MKFRVVYLSLLFVILAVAVPVANADARSRRGDGDGDEKVERSIAVDPAVAISLCMASGNIIVRGWERNEVRASSGEDVKIELAHAPAATPGASTKKLEIDIFNKDESENAGGKCQAFSDISIKAQTVAPAD